MATILKMNRNRKINLPSAFIGRLSLGEDRYFKAEISGNRITLIPIDPVERTFSEEDWEAYIEGRVRLITRLEESCHFLLFVGNHDHIRQFLRKN